MAREVVFGSAGTRRTLSRDGLVYSENFFCRAGVPLHTGARSVAFVHMLKGRSSAMAFFRDQLKQVFRRLSRAPLFTAITLITLTVGIGANTVVFSVVDGVLLKPLSYPRPDELIGVWT